MNRLTSFFICLSIFALALCLPMEAKGVEISQSVKSAQAELEPSSTIDLLLSFENDLDVTALKMDHLRRKMSRQENYRLVMERLYAGRRSLESSISGQLQTLQAAGEISEFRFFTSSKTVLVSARLSAITHLEALPGVRLIILNQKISLIEPVSEEPTQLFAKPTIDNTALNAIGITSLWSLGLTGRGRLICSFDTGVDADHPALSSKWRGNNGGSASESWYSPRGDSLPFDKIGHGSHTMGVMVGSTAEDTIGLAPDAEWISAAVIDQGAGFSTTLADILSAFDWALNPDGDLSTFDDVPDVICNSWGVPVGILGTCDNTFWTAIDNVEAAGILTVFAAGNEGPSPGTVRNPADRAASPTNAMAIGAINPADNIIAGFSSRGPSGCDNAIKPDLVAPGVNIYSSHKDGSYKVMSGTSMAVPFVAGLALLIRQYNPEVTVEEIKNALMQSANDLGPVGDDNSYGRGAINAAQVLGYIEAPRQVQVVVAGHTISSGSDQFADPGEEAQLVLSINEPSGLSDSIDIYLTSLSEYVSIPTDTIRFYFSPGSTFTTSTDSFLLSISQQAISGEIATLVANYFIPGGTEQQTAEFSIQLGQPLPGLITSLQAGEIDFGFSDFGQFGFGTGSIYQAGGVGFRFKSGPNLLYEGGLIVARSASMVSDAIRQADGSFKASDFFPEPGGPILPATSVDSSLMSQYSDEKAVAPIPISIRQNISHNNGNYIIVEFELINPMPEVINNLSAAFFCDFDLIQFDDQLEYDELTGMLYQYNLSSGDYVGLVGLGTNQFGYLAINNSGNDKVGISKLDKYELTMQAVSEIRGTGRGDWYMVVSRQISSLGAFASDRFAVGLVAGNSLADLRLAAGLAAEDYMGVLDADDDLALLPDQLEMKQNYPNPFNPATTIKYILPAAQMVHLNVYNVAGQKVRTLFDGLARAGENSIIWDGRDDSNRSVASGVYFYRLQTAHGEVLTRKMALLK